MRYISLAFTGYRTEKLPFLPDENNLSRLKHRLKDIIKKEAARGIKYFMTGMCRGSDLIAADAVLELKDELGVELWCAVPFKNHRSTVPDGELGLYDRVLSMADGVVVLHKSNAAPAEFGKLYNLRNRYMVEHCDGLIAVCEKDNILPGGTRNTVMMAQSAGKKIIYAL